MVDRVSKKIRFLGLGGILAKSLFWFLIFTLTLSFTINLGLAHQLPSKPPQEWQLKGIMAALDDPDPQIWTLALDKLTEYKIDELKIYESSYEKIVELLSDDNLDVQIAAVKAFGEMGEVAASQAPQLVKILETSKDKEVQVAVAQALGEMGEAAASQAPQLVKILETSKDNIYVQVVAVKALGEMGEAAASQAPQLGKLLETSKDTYVQVAVAQALGKVGEAAASQVPQLGKLLETSKDTYVQEVAVKALGEMGEAASSQAPQLVKLLETSKDIYVQRTAAKVIGEMGEAASSQAPQLVKLLETSKNKEVQKAAAEALGGMGEAASSQVPQLGRLLETSKDTYVQRTAARVLGKMGEAAASQVSQLVKLLETSKDINVQRAAVEALGERGEAAASQVPQLGRLLETSKDRYVQIAAVEALGKMGEAASSQAPQLVKILETSKDRYVQVAAAEALGKMGEAASSQAPQLVKILETSKDIRVQRAAAEALGKMGETASSQAPQLVKILETSKDIYVQEVVAKVLGEMGEAASSQVPQLVKLLETSKDTRVQRAAVKALGEMGEAASSQAPQLGRLLENSKDRYVQEAAVKVLGEMGEAASSQAPQLVKLLVTSKDIVGQRASKALERMGQVNTATILSILNNVYGNQSQTSRYRFHAYFLSGGQEKSIIAIQWFGLPLEYPDLTKLDRAQTIKILKVFDYVWQPSQSLPRLRSDLEKQIAKVIKQGKWKFQDIGLLTKHYQNLQSVNSTHADAVKAKIAQLEGWKWFFAAWKIWLAHFFFWLLLIFAYPRFPQIQAIFFWNPWVRKIIGFGYVGFLITWIPFLRSKLFIPFKQSLLADAKLDYSDLQSYFDKSQVKQEASGKIKLLKETIPEIKGQIILQGESGLGKSLFLRYLAKNSQRILVYLSADRCTDGVIEAIQNKLLGKAKDSDFLRNLIYSGAIDICLDGLNEVNADTRANIKKFVEEYFKGNIIMTTQPLEWKPPTTASIYILQPLQDDLIKEFLLSRQSYLAEDNQLQNQDYPQACQNYLAKALNQNLPSEELAATQNILSNPMDLTILGQVIASGEEPDLFRLQEQQYELMAADYQNKQHQKFPLAKFSEHAYQIRLNNSTLSEIDFWEELQCMLRHKMVICQKFRNAQAKNVQEWKFRHDKIWDYFILQTFLGEDNELPNKHKKEPGFRGVYFLLANLLPLDEADKLRENLIQYAANSGDHTVSDRFIQILQTRKTTKNLKWWGK